MANRWVATAVGVILVAALAAPGALVAHGEATTKGAASTKAQQIKAGKALYAANCSSCHQPDGVGIPGEVPPLAGSDYLAKGSTHAIAVVLHGLKGELKVHGKAYDSTMPQLFQLSNQEVADVLTYVYNSWGNPGGRIDASDVAAQRYDRALAPRDE